MIRNAGARVPEVLLVEDNENDVILTREGFKRARVVANLRHVDNGRACIAYLRKEDPYEAVPTPDLILLDLNMPIMDGREVLAEIVADKALRQLPVVVLTTSDAERDVVAMYELRCSSYVTKPIDFHEFVRLIGGLGEYWFTVVVLPPKAGNAGAGAFG